MLGRSTWVGTASTMVLPVRVRSSWLAYWVIITTTAFCLRAVTSQFESRSAKYALSSAFQASSMTMIVGLRSSITRSTRRKR